MSSPVIFIRLLICILMCVINEYVYFLYVCMFVFLVVLVAFSVFAVIVITVLPLGIVKGWFMDWFIHSFIRKLRKLRSAALKSNDDDDDDDDDDDIITCIRVEHVLSLDAFCRWHSTRSANCCGLEMIVATFSLSCLILPVGNSPKRNGQLPLLAWHMINYLHDVVCLSVCNAVHCG